MVGSIEVDVMSDKFNGKVEPLPEEFDPTTVISEPMERSSMAKLKNMKISRRILIQRTQIQL
uniref:Uncharacterized protein n=1 Tax=Nelumbo nucifera TaxID=4432 RepID=A0A822Y0E4_NELNU|nr:TPA_asm: hypothetical protein HUJ06_028852 [Nelumbo nucifera]